MTARISLVASLMAVVLFSCDTERNIAPVFKTYYTKYYGEDGNQLAVDLAVNSDGTMVMVGTSQSQTNRISHAFIVKIDNEGTVLWQRQMGDSNEEPVDVEFDSRNDIIVVSNYQSRSIRITRIGQSGASIDSMMIENPAGIFGTAITEVNDGTGQFFLISGYAGPGLVGDGEPVTPSNDEQDLLIYKVQPDFDTPAKLESEQGGEKVGKIAKIFQSPVSGPTRYYRFGDSDRPFSADGAFRQTFEVVRLNEFFVSSPTLAQSGSTGEVQISSEAIAMPIAGQPGYVMVGSTGQSVYKQIFVTQYNDLRPELTVRFSRVIGTPRSAEGISVAYGEQESIFVLADELQENNNHDIYLAKLESDGAFGGEMRFGSIEGNDQAAAVRVLPDQRVAIFGTIELETQKKMMLTLISPRGTFSE